MEARIGCDGVAVVVVERDQSTYIDASRRPFAVITGQRVTSAHALKLEDREENHITGNRTLGGNKTIATESE